MVDFLLALLVSGPETTPAMMTLVVKFLTDNPSALALVKEEQVRIRERKKGVQTALEWSDYKTMPFTASGLASGLAGRVESENGARPGGSVANGASLREKIAVRKHVCP
ncbi:Cytochrome P450 90A1 [Platanthera guangdongensis]|uniref:Cytochrome P450 90A1 n=1 Tax=Platanthera guangdongensis TaxID=2320717 RepID=A0ABR2LYJ5_9ASPA